MYVPKHFAVEDAHEIRAFIEREPFGILVSCEGAVPIGTHVPIVVIHEEPLRLGLHLAEANPQWRALDGRDVLAIFHGPHAMISANWYESPQRSVPTWNYEAVHCTGTASIASAAATRRILEQIVSRFEPSWRIEDADSEYIARMERAIVGVEIAVRRVEAVRKHSQNRSAADRERIIGALAGSPRVPDREVARLMRSV